MIETFLAGYAEEPVARPFDGRGRPIRERVELPPDAYSQGVNVTATPDVHYVEPIQLEVGKTIPKSAFLKQVGGDHYKKYRISPIVFAEANGLTALQWSVLKYILRAKDKDGFQDLDKAHHCIEMMKEHYHPDRLHSNGT
jgi:hypothetical protein